VVRADPRRQRLAVVVVLVALILGAFGVAVWLPALSEWVATDTSPGRVSRARMVCLALGGIIVLLSVAVMGSGRRIARYGKEAVAAGRFPPPGMPVLRDGVPLTGRPAVLLGKFYRGIGITLAILGAALLVLGGYVVVLLWP
jgi:hypothetical protein